MDVDQNAGEVAAMGDTANNPKGDAAPLIVGAGAGNKVVASGGTAGSVTVSLHPLVIMNISEHWTRTRAQNDGKPQQGIYKHRL